MPETGACKDHDADRLDNKHQACLNQLCFGADANYVAPALNQPGKGSVSLDPNYPLVKVLRARPGHEGDQEEGKNGQGGAIVQTANRGHFADARHSCYCLHTTSSSWIFQRHFQKEDVIVCLRLLQAKRDIAPNLGTP